MANNNKKNGDPTTQEAIHGKKVTIGKGTGERVGRKAVGAAKTRAQRIREELKGVFD
ncbi:hypothetical protein KAR91_09855 [Candidatus Pacearchaeota archaeon]|nr:hypothetical protein [Candidatus Pacearchaeota archaeon]